MGTRTAPWREQTCWIPRMQRQSAKPMRSPPAHAPSGPEVFDFTKGRIYGCMAGLITSLEISLQNRGRPYTVSSLGSLIMELKLDTRFRRNDGRALTCGGEGRKAGGTIGTARCEFIVTLGSLARRCSRILANASSMRRNQRNTIPAVLARQCFTRKQSHDTGSLPAQGRQPALDHSHLLERQVA